MTPDIVFAVTVMIISTGFMCVLTWRVPVNMHAAGLITVDRLSGVTDQDIPTVTKLIRNYRFGDDIEHTMKSIVTSYDDDFFSKSSAAVWYAQLTVSTFGLILVTENYTHLLFTPLLTSFVPLFVAMMYQSTLYHPMVVRETLLSLRDSVQQKKLQW